MTTTRFTSNLIAPCGMNCGVCRAYLREKNRGLGCNVAGQRLPKSREFCYMRTCDKRKGKFCFRCDEFPCKRLKHLDKRYRTKYGMSEIDNLNYIKEHGIRKFLDRERRCWISDKGVFCVHDRKRY